MKLAIFILMTLIGLWFGSYAMAHIPVGHWTRFPVFTMAYALSVMGIIFTTLEAVDLWVKK